MLKSRVHLFLNVIMIFPEALKTPETKDQGNQTFSERLTEKEEPHLDEEDSGESDFAE